MSHTQQLQQTIKQIMFPGKGILAADESVVTIKKRLEKERIESTPETRRQYRELLFSAPGIEKYISGVIMYDEQIRQNTNAGQLFSQLLAGRGIAPGIKVDKGLIDLDGDKKEKVVEGLDGLRERLQEYYQLGARFAKYRAVFNIGDKTPSEYAIYANLYALARYAAICQEVGIVPIVEPEVLMDGNHDLNTCCAITIKILRALFAELRQHPVDINCMLLKPNMILPGENFAKRAQISHEQIAKSTLDCLLSSVPAEVPGIVFLSGGQTEIEACENLNAISLLKKSVPWPISFSFGRALQTSALHTWAGKEKNIPAAVETFVRRAQMASAASVGEYREII